MTILDDLREKIRDEIVWHQVAITSGSLEWNDLDETAREIINEAEQKIRDRIAELVKKKEKILEESSALGEEATILIERENGSDPMDLLSEQESKEREAEQIEGAIAELQTLVAVSTKGE